jgi:hypothetical protein
MVAWIKQALTSHYSGSADLCGQSHDLIFLHINEIPGR